MQSSLNSLSSFTVVKSVFWPQVPSSQKSKKHKEEMSQLHDKMQVLEAKEEQLKLERDSVK